MNTQNMDVRDQDWRNKKRKRVSGKFCVAGGPSQTSCNNSKTEGVSLHLCPSNKAFCDSWTCFILGHRANWQPTKSSVFCSAHFHSSWFEQQLDLNLDETDDTLHFKLRRWLKKDAVQTIDCAAVIPDGKSKAVSEREHRMVGINNNDWKFHITVNLYMYKVPRTLKNFSRDYLQC